MPTTPISAVHTRRLAGLASASAVATALRAASGDDRQRLVQQFLAIFHRRYFPQQEIILWIVEQALHKGGDVEELLDEGRHFWVLLSGRKCFHDAEFFRLLEQFIYLVFHRCHFTHWQYTGLRDRMVNSLRSNHSEDILSVLFG